MIEATIKIHPDDLQTLKNLVKNGWVASKGYSIDIVANLVRQIEKQINESTRNPPPG